MALSTNNRFGYGFALVGISLSYLLDKVFSPLTGLIVAVLGTVLGFILLYSGHVGQEESSGLGRRGKIGPALLLILAIGTIVYLGVKALGHGDLSSTPKMARVVARKPASSAVTPPVRAPSESSATASEKSKEKIRMRASENRANPTRSAFRRTALPHKERRAPDRSLVPSRKAKTLPPPLPKLSAYVHLKKVVEEVNKESNDWVNGVDMCQDSHDMWLANVEGPGEPPTQSDRTRASVRYALCMKGFEDRFHVVDSTTIRDAVEDAIVRMQLPGMEQITPNQASAIRQECKVAVTKSHTVPSLENPAPDVNYRLRFKPLLDFLTRLLKRLGNYPESPKG